MDIRTLATLTLERRGGAGMKGINEAIAVLEEVLLVNRAVTRPFIEKKTGIKVVSAGRDYGEIVTQVDLGVSQALLDGGIREIRGFRSLYPGSFSEEQDSPERMEALEIIQLDPIDGTGDFADTYQTSKVMPPTTLVSKLTRPTTHDLFQPEWGIIFDVVNEIALVSDGEAVFLFGADEHGLKEVPYERTKPPWKEGEVIYINRRVSYPQLTYDGPFMDFLQKNLNIVQVPTGGAGIFAMQVFRNYIQPTGPGAEAFANLQPITIGFNCQPDWKTWDTDPTEVIAAALKMPRRCDAFNNTLHVNAAAQTLAGMHHKSGFVLSTSHLVQMTLCATANDFKDRNRDCPLTAKNYGYKDAIVAMARGKQNDRDASGNAPEDSDAFVANRTRIKIEQEVGSFAGGISSVIERNIREALSARR